MKWFFTVFLAFGSVALTAEKNEEIHHVKIELDLYCPYSDELEAFIETIKSREDEFTLDYREWVCNLRYGIEKLNLLLDSEQIYRGEIHMNHDKTDTLPK
ncbi:MAG: hypothetical protein KDK56_08280 [Simkania sp.]|nr:hypothetical protein [Simkania sp.]MCP5489610.1 hypothetical protein [Chlamydiales bacterium]